MYIVKLKYIYGCFATIICLALFFQSTNFGDAVWVVHPICNGGIFADIKELVISDQSDDFVDIEIFTKS